MASVCVFAMTPQAWLYGHALVKEFARAHMTCSNAQLHLPPQALQSYNLAYFLACACNADDKGPSHHHQLASVR